jgi:hypothetical protein
MDRLRKKVSRNGRNLEFLYPGKAANVALALLVDQLRHWGALERDVTYFTPVSMHRNTLQRGTDWL